MHRPIDPAAVAALRRTVRGRVAYPADPAYAVARDARPAAVVLAADEADVEAAVRVARSHGLGVGRADGALLVDVTRLTDVVVDLDTRTATAGVGATWREVLAAAAPYGLAPVPPWRLDGLVGPAVLGGAVGPFTQRLGLCSDHVRLLRVVGADGTARPADGDLRHALLGGPAPGVVTAVDLALDGPTTVTAAWLGETRRRITSDGAVRRDACDDETAVAVWLDRVDDRQAPWEQGFLLAGGSTLELCEVLTAVAADAREVVVDVLGAATDRATSGPGQNAADAFGAHYLVTVRADVEPAASPARLLEPWLTGGSLAAHHGVADDHHPVDLCWSPAAAARTAVLRRSHDPHGLFR